MRKKLPLISGILNVLEKLKGNTGIIENTSVATHTIAAGKYVIWKNDLYKASSAISIGDTLSLSNLTAVSDGIANELNSKMQNPVLIYSTTTAQTDDTEYSLLESIENYRLLLVQATETANNDLFVSSEIIPVSWLKDNYSLGNDTDKEIFHGLRSAFIVYGFKTSTTIRIRTVSGAKIVKIFGIK